MIKKVYIWAKKHRGPLIPGSFQDCQLNNDLKLDFEAGEDGSDSGLSEQKKKHRGPLILVAI